jgi:hypothetical protein
MTAARKATTDGRIERMGARLQVLLGTLPDDAAITDILDYVIGALYALKRAKSLGFADRSGAHDKTYRPYLKRECTQLVDGNMLHSRWFGGFYFNSAIQRLAANYDRIPKLLGARSDKARDRMIDVSGSESRNWYLVYKEVNALKHAPRGKAQGRRVTVEIALSAVEELLDLVEAKAADISAR